MTVLRVEVDGAPAGPDELADVLVRGESHYSTMQVRQSGVRGLDLHLARLTAAHREVFRTALDAEHVRSLMRHVVAGHPDCSLRVSVDEPEPGRPRVVAVVRRPVEPRAEPLALGPVSYVRPFAHLKNAGTFGQHAHARQVVRAGFDEALLVTPDGRVCETNVANVGFLDGGRVVWPDGPALAGISRQLLDAALPAAGIDTSTEPVRLDALAGFDGAFTCNSIGVVPVGRIGMVELPGSRAALRSLHEAYDAVPWTPL